MSETVFYFIRHGQTEYNRKRIVQGRGIDAPLNAMGKAQAAVLANRMRHAGLDAIYSSPLQRAVQTADAIARFHADVPRYQLADLEEMSWGRYEGVGTSPELTAMFSAMQAEWARGAYDRPFEGGESILDVQRRAVRAIDHLLVHHEGETVLVVTHGRYLRVLLATLLEDYGLARMQEIKHANTAVNHIVYRNGCYEAPLLNCTAHLDRAESLVID